MVEHIVIALSNCVLNFSELEEIVESLKPSDLMHFGRRSQWVLKAQVIESLFTRLQSSKVSLNLMITPLTWQVGLGSQRISTKPNVYSH